jgi:hypothetical protein
VLESVTECYRVTAVVFALCYCSMYSAPCSLLSSLFFWNLMIHAFFSRRIHSILRRQNGYIDAKPHGISVLPSEQRYVTQKHTRTRTHIDTCEHTYAHTHTHIHARTYAHTLAHIHTRKCKDIFLCIQILTNMQTCTLIHLLAHAETCLHTHTHTHTHIRSHTHAKT